MNIHSPIHPSVRRGFTLIELLVVISIIAILASLAMPTYNVILRKAREVQAKSVMSSLVTAIKSYQVEYNKVPSMTNPNPPTAPITQDGSPFPTDSTSTIMGCLTATDTTNNPTNNPRLISFFNPPPYNGIAGYNTTTSVLTDPWGMPYWVALDDNGDGVITNPYYSNAAFPTDPATIPGTAILWSNGTNKTEFDSDDVRSWK